MLWNTKWLNFRSDQFTQLPGPILTNSEDVLSPGLCLNMKNIFPGITQPPYLYNGNPYTGETSLYYDIWHAFRQQCCRGNVAVMPSMCTDVVIFYKLVVKHMAIKKKETIYKVMHTSYNHNPIVAHRKIRTISIIRAFDIVVTEIILYYTTKLMRNSRTNAYRYKGENSSPSSRP